MKRKLICHVPSFTANYEIEVGSGLLQNRDVLEEPLKQLGSRFALITDDNVKSLHAIALQDRLKIAGLDVSLFSIPPGEKVKTRETKEELENRLFDQGFGRDTCILALGGGVVTDLAGYLAATYCRGVPLVMIPTSLLAMVDASIGGKVGVNVPHGKNLVGCFYQPKKVIIDPMVLKSLPLKEIRNGFVEVIKHALIADDRLFQFLHEHYMQLIDLEASYLEQVILESCRIKKEIVEGDEKEVGMRRLLNFGHTIGHALENLTHYHLSHGEAVVIGILVEARMALLLGFLSQSSFDQILTLFRHYGLPFKLPIDISLSDITKVMTLDKKALGGRARFVVLKEIGSPLTYHGDFCTSLDDQVIMNALQWMKNDLCCD